MLFTLLMGAVVGVDPNDPPPLPNPIGRSIIIGEAPPSNALEAPRSRPVSILAPEPAPAASRPPTCRRRWSSMCRASPLQPRSPPIRLRPRQPRPIAGL